MNLKNFLTFLTTFLSITHLAVSDESFDINNLCRFRFGKISHPNPTSCHKFVQCQFISGVVEECQPGMIFDTKSGCTIGKRESCVEKNLDIVESLGQIAPKLDLDEICLGTEVAFRPHPTECTLFIVCVFGEGEVRSCPSHSPIFDPTRSLCVEGNADTCEIFRNTPTPETTIPTTTIPETTTSENTSTPSTTTTEKTTTPTTTTTETTTTPTTTTTEKTTTPTTTTTETITTPTTTTTEATTPTIPITTTPEEVTTTTTVTIRTPEPTTTPGQTTTTPTTTPVTTTTPGPTTTPSPTTPVLTTTPGTTTTNNLPTTTIGTTIRVPPNSEICRGNNMRFIADPDCCYCFFFCILNIPTPGTCAEDRIFATVGTFSGCVLGDQQTCTRDDNIINITVYPTRPQ